MRKDKIIYLISTTSGDNDIGDPIQIPVKRETFATRKSIRQSEFYQAAATDLKPEISFEIWALEYKGESALLFEGKTFNIIRTFQPNEKDIELICSGLVILPTESVIPDEGG